MSPRPARAARRTQGRDPARRLAWDVLRAVDEDDAYANLVLARLLAERQLDVRDAALATELAYGTLRGRGTIDAVLAACASRPPEQVDPPLLDALRLGAHQLLAMRVPAHAAVSQTVELAREVAGEGPARFANAVLRRVAAHDIDGWTRLVVPAADVDLVGHLSVALSHPEWVVRAFLDALGGDVEATADLLRADNTPAEVALAARPGRCDVAELVAAGARAGRWSPYAAVLSGGDPRSIAAVRQGRAGVQDEGSQLVTLALAAAPLEGPDSRWADLCAGPGGKAALLSGLAGLRGASLLAAELRAHRTRLVVQALRGSTGRHLAVTADARAPAWAAGGFDRVLVDVPCTGLGALRRRPEARWRRSPADVAALAPLQRDLLRAALDAVRPGGVVGYVTCSPHIAETTVVVSDVLRARPDVERLDARPLLRGVPDLGADPDVQLWPHRHGTDAMYLALLRRRAPRS